MMARNRNYMPKAQKRLIAGVAAAVVVLGGAGVAWAASQPPAKVAEPTPAPVATTAPPAPAPTPTPTPEPVTTTTTTAPPALVVDTSKPEEVARAWAKAYFTRPTGNDQEFLAAIKPYVAPSLMEYMRTDEFNIDKKGYFDQSEGTRVLDVKITPQDGSVGVDTPIRWTRTVTVTVQGLSTGKKVNVPYTLELRRSDTYWFIIGAPKAIRIGD